MPIFLGRLTTSTINCDLRLKWKILGYQSFDYIDIIDDISSGLPVTVVAERLSQGGERVGSGYVVA